MIQHENNIKKLNEITYIIIFIDVSHLKNSNYFIKNINYKRSRGKLLKCDANCYQK